MEKRTIYMIWSLVVLTAGAILIFGAEAMWQNVNRWGTGLPPAQRTLWLSVVIVLFWLSFAFGAYCLYRQARSRDDQVKWAFFVLLIVALLLPILTNLKGAFRDQV
ncbi:MAG: hypothetical protein U0R49_00485 [Fimbriimonadales bacterium]